MWSKRLASFGMLLIAGAADAATIERQPLDGSHDLIVVSGTFEQNDDSRFREIAATTGSAVVLLNSEGGSVLAALEIGRTIRLKGFGTAVAKDTLCASACALTWLAGSPRLLSGTSNIGFHASYVVNEGRASESGVGNALIGAYLNQIGLSQDAIIFVTSAPPEGMEWLSPEKALHLGIPVATLEESPAEIAPITTKAAPELYNPMRAVAQFYGALSIADGESASALVIPEKRGIGPFNEKAIHSFFGGLSKPLEVTSIAKQSANKIEVGYNYVDSQGNSCDGKAIVNTTFAYGKTLIQKIKALSGC